MKATEKIPVIRRLYPSLMKRWAHLTWTGGHKVKRYDGLLLLLNWHNYVDRHVGLLGGYEREQVAFFLARMARGCDCFIDVGANFGLYTLQVAKSGFAPLIHAFEPDPRNFAQLTGNLYLNRMTGKVHAHKLAVSEKAGLLPFYLDPGTSTGQTRVAAEIEATESLDAVTLDDMFSFTGKKIFIKMDIEGHEAAALKGAENLLRNNSCFLQIESLEGGREKVAALMKDAGYALSHQIGSDFYYTNGGSGQPQPALIR